MKRPFDLPAGEIMDLVQEALRISARDGLISEFAARQAVLENRRFACDSEQREELVGLVKSGMGHMSAHSQTPRTTSFVGRSSEAFERSTEAGSINFEHYSVLSSP